jgi:hypothetical protein
MKKKGKMKRSTKIKTSVVIIVGGLVLTAYCNRGLFKAKASASWPGTKGEIISSEIKRAIFTPGRRRGTTRKPRYYIFKARYQYEVDGEAYSSERVSFLSTYISREKYSDIRDKYAAGKTVDVFYNPDAAGEAVLIKGVNKYNKNPHSVMGIIGVCVGIFGIIVYGLNYLKKGND